MKRIISALLLMAMCFMLLTGCMCKHEWQDATCTTPTTCTLCGKTEGVATGHIEGASSTGEIDIAAKTSYSYVLCGVCGETLSSDLVDLTSFISGGQFIYTPNQFNDAMNNYGGYTYEIDTLDSGALISMIYSGGTLIGAIMYLSDGDSLTLSDADSAVITDMLCYWYTDDTEVIIYAMIDIVCGVDASCNDSSANSILSNIIDSYGSTYYANGMTYSVLLNEGDFVFTISIG